MLPALRQELTLYAGPTGASGAPTWSLHDPTRNTYFRIDWLTFEILSRWDLPSAQAIAQAVSTETSIHDVEAEDVDAVLQFLSEQELLQRNDPGFSLSLSQRLSKQRGSVWTWLLHHYLFFRVPLWKPDAWLNRMQGRVGILYSPWFFASTGLALLTGLILLGQQWDRFTASFIDFFSWQGLGAYAVTLVAVKFGHELGHALTAKRMGCRVPTMGIAFLVMFPMAYTDVNDVWKLPQRRQRLAVGAAGIVTELIVAAWATLAWVLVPDGQLRTALFLLASTTWISTLLINALPFLRFDGYFLLMDWLDMPNLHARSFEMAKWRLRRALFGLQTPPPEALSGRRQRGLILFAMATWLYRLVVFTGIAVLVYTVFAKPLGPFLAAIELSWFVALPILREVKTWGRYVPNLMTTMTGFRTLAIGAGLIAATLTPWDTRISGQGVLKPQQTFPLIAPGGARLVALQAQNGTEVAAGTELISLDQVDLNYQKQALNARAQSLTWQAKISGVNANSRQQQQTVQAKLAKVNSELDSLARQRQQFILTAPFAGTFYLSDPGLSPGVWVGKNEKIGELVAPGGLRVETYLAEIDIRRLNIGDVGKFYPESGFPEPVDLRVEAIDKDASHELREGLLASTRGGTLAVREHNKTLVPEHAVYRVVLSVQQRNLRTGLPVLRGQVVIHGQAQAWALNHLRTGLAVFRREAGF